MSVNDEILGAIFVGSVLAIMLYGIACMQTWVYSRHSQRDRLMFKITVYTIAILNTTQMIAQSYMLYRWFVTDFGSGTVALAASIPSCIQVAIAALSDLIVRSFFARRVYIVCGQKKRLMGSTLSGFIFATALTVCVLSLVYNAKSYILGIQPNSDERSAALNAITYLLYVMYSLSAVVDLTIAASLSGLLWNKKTGIKKTDELVTFWVLFSIHTGLVTSVFAILALILLATHPESLYSLGVNYVLTQLHVNSLLASLNARDAFRTNSTYNTSNPEADGHLSLGPSGPVGSYKAAPSPKLNFANLMTYGHLRGSGGGGGGKDRGLYEVEMPLSRTNSTHSKKLVVGKKEEVRVYTDDGKAVEL